MKKNNNKWYSVIISMLLIGFLLVLTTGVFNLVLKELNDNRWMWDSIKAFAWAEASQELALLKIKEKGYGIDNEIDHNISTGSIILSDNTDDISKFKRNKEIFISYNLNILADLIWLEYLYSEELLPYSYSIIPLFYEKEGEAIINVDTYNLQIWWRKEDLVWNLISEQEWIGNIWNETRLWNWKKIIINWSWNPEAKFISNESIDDFLSIRNNAYLILFNSWNTNLNITITSWRKFSKPKTTILSSAQVWKYRHNLETKYDNTEFLNMLKYAVFSN